MLKVDFHLHTADDPADKIPYTSAELVDRAAELEFDALAITLHDRQLDAPALTAYARERGIVLIPGVERTLLGKHVLLLNFPPEAAFIGTLEALADLRARHPAGLVVAPHPFFPLSNCLGRVLRDRADLFDAVEINGCFTRQIDFNRGAIRWAASHGKPLVGSSDAHRLSMLGRTYSVVDAELDAAEICAAVKDGRVEGRATPLSLPEAVGYFAQLTFNGQRRRDAGAAIVGTGVVASPTD
jgi:predicted metal-dependent phosphoesterase TrpH